MFERLVTHAMERPELLAEFASMPERIRRRDELDRIVGEWVGASDAPAALARLDAAQVPCSLVNSVSDFSRTPRWRLARTS